MKRGKERQKDLVWERNSFWGLILVILSELRWALIHMRHLLLLSSDYDFTKPNKFLISYVSCNESQFYCFLATHSLKWKGMKFTVVISLMRYTCSYFVEVCMSVWVRCMCCVPMSGDVAFVFHDFYHFGCSLKWRMCNTNSGLSLFYCLCVLYISLIHSAH